MKTNMKIFQADEAETSQQQQQPTLREMIKSSGRREMTPGDLDLVRDKEHKKWEAHGNMQKILKMIKFLQMIFDSWKTVLL